LGANVIGCHIRPQSDAEFPYREGIKVPRIFGGKPLWTKFSSIEEAEQFTVDTEALFKRMAESYGYPLIGKARKTPGAVWMEKTGSPEKVLGIHGPLSDLMIVSRPRTQKSVLAYRFLMSCLLNTSRPVLMLPPRYRAAVPKRICIAWNQSKQAALAVAAALPLLKGAEDVHIVSCGKENLPGPKSVQLERYLKYWGINCRRVNTRGTDEVSEFESQLQENGSELVVMGAYSHNRFSRTLMGSMTDHMVRNTRTPVMMIHP
jgi:nucleotide-binding universal stress UspA family protein